MGHHFSDSGAVPDEILGRLDSEVYHLKAQMTGSDGMTTRLRAVEIEVGHVSRVVKWGVGLLSALLAAGFGSVLAAVLTKGK